MRVLVQVRYCGVCTQPENFLSYDEESHTLTLEQNVWGEGDDYQEEKSLLEAHLDGVLRFSAVVRSFIPHALLRLMRNHGADLYDRPWWDDGFPESVFESEDVVGIPW